jgi:Cys-tRNA(Pro)/Cys-tRNA(Cys) deacylase
MGSATRATGQLDREGVPYVEHRYQVVERVGYGYGEAVAEAIGLPPERVFKTLVADIDSVAVLAVVPVDRRLSTRRLARAAGGKRCSMVSPEDAERLTGYVTGGISPFGQKKKLPVYVDDSAGPHHSIAVSGGKRGLQIELSPTHLVSLTGATLVALTDD